MITYSVGQPILLEHKKKALNKLDLEGFIKNLAIYGSPNSRPLVSLQITAYCEGAGLLNCLDSVQVQGDQNFEIVLVDNGLDSVTKEKLKSYDLVYIEADRNLGCSHGRNLGAVFSRGELIVFIDADGYVEKNYIKNAIKAMEDKSVIAVRGKVLPTEETASKPVPVPVPVHYDLGDEVVPSVINTEGNSIWRLKDYLGVGGFENSLYGSEGPVLCYRMHVLYGYQKEAFRYDPSIVLYHNYSSDSAHLAQKSYRKKVINVAIANRYPGLAEFTKYYRTRGARRPNIRDARIVKVEERTNTRVAAESRAHYKKLAMQRRTQPALVKQQDHYDFCVVIPNYNLGKLLVEAVESIRMQSIESVQIIVVDDASTEEKTKRILRELEEDVEVVYLENNSGVANARNQGIKRAKSDYLLCLDADDTIEPTYLEKARNMFLLYPKAGIVAPWTQYSGVATGTWKVRSGITLADALVASPVPTASAFRRDAWEKAGGYEAEMSGYEDWEFWISILEQRFTIEVIPELLFNYRRRPNSKITTSNKNVDVLVGKIYQNHRDSYQKNLEHVLIERQRESNARTAEIRRLRAQSSKLQPKYSARKFLGVVFDSRNGVNFGRRVVRFFRTAFFRLRRSPFSKK